MADCLLHKQHGFLACEVLSRKELKIVGRWSEFSTSEMRAPGATVVMLLPEHPNQDLNHFRTCGFVTKAIVYFQSVQMKTPIRIIIIILFSRMFLQF
jgi:hypothetical protein